MTLHMKLSLAALNDEVQDHLHPAITHTIQAVGWLHKTAEKAGFPFGKPNLRQTIEFGREQLREALRELDTFEAAVYPADPEAIRDSIDGDAQGAETEGAAA